MIAVTGKRTFCLSNGTREFTRNRRFLRKMPEAKVETTPVSKEGASAHGQATDEQQGHQAKADERWGKSAQADERWGKQA